MQTFDDYGVSFVSVTQQFNTTNSMGRLTLNILLSFAQFEREMISERTRDKMGAARRKGKFSGGPPVLGYDIVESKLVINQSEAKRVRQIFALYLQQGGLLPTIAAMRRKGWRTKRWTTKKGRTLGGRSFDKTRLHNLLTNVVYRGQVCYREVVYTGEQAAIVDAETFTEVQELLQANQNSGNVTRRESGALLKGLLYCAACGCRMSPAHTLRSGNRRYRYYVCSRAQKRGYDQCPTKSVSAGEIERTIIKQVSKALPEIDAVWETLTSQDQRNCLQQVITRIEYDRSAGTLNVVFDAEETENFIQNMETDEATS